MKAGIPRREFFKRASMATFAATCSMTPAAAMSCWPATARAAQPSAVSGPGSSPGPTAKDTFALLGAGKKIPVILDTDIGNDIDDTWALTMMMKSPELDVKLVTSDSGNDIYRARVIAKMLEVCRRTDVPVGVGLSRKDEKSRQSEWVGDYDLADYPGKVYDDGVDAIIKTIRASQDPITLICIGPVPNIPEVLKRDPGIARRARFVGMHGSVRRGYGGSRKISAEYNVRADPKALQAVFAAGWDVSITPLDTCGIVRLGGEKFQKVYRSKDPATQALMANYRVWRKDRSSPITASSVLFDTVAVYMAFTEDLLGMEDLKIRVTDDGRTVIDEKARMARCATKWKDLGAFEDLLVARLTGE